jgi:hypothetical protein
MRGLRASQNVSPQTNVAEPDQPAPAIGCVGMAGANVSPAERLLEETEGVFHGEATQLPTPEHAQVSRQRTADPGQPQGPGWQPLIGQALDLDADHAEGCMWCAAHVELGPDVDADDAVGRVVQLTRSLRLAIHGLVRQPKWRTMQAWSTTTELSFGGAIHDALLGQAHQHVSVDFSDCQGLQVVASVERDHGPRLTGWLRFPHRDDLIQGHVRRRLGRRSTPLYIQRQHPAASRIRHSNQPLWYAQAGTTPFWAQPGSGRYSQVRWVLARAAARGQLVPSITHSGRPSTTAESVRVRTNNSRSAATSTDPSASASHVLTQRRRKSGCQTEPHQRAAVRRRQRRIHHQFKQAILTKAQVVVERLTEVAEPLPSIGF